MSTKIANTQTVVIINSLVNELVKDYKRMTINNTILGTRIINVNGYDVTIGVRISINPKHYPDLKCIVSFRVSLVNIPINVEMYNANIFNTELTVDTTDYNFSLLYEFIKKTFYSKI